MTSGIMQAHVPSETPERYSYGMFDSGHPFWKFASSAYKTLQWNGNL